jgi:hypothetical protein
MNGACACGALMYAKGMCRRCYDRQRMRVLRSDQDVRAKERAADKVRRASMSSQERFAYLAKRKADRERYAARRRAHRKVYYARNKECEAENRRAWAKENPDKTNEARRRDYRKNKAARNAVTSEWRRRNLQRKRAIEQKYRDRNREKCRERLRAVQAHRRTTRVPWADMKAIAAIYRESHECSKREGIQYEVDHFYPLKGKTVSGLHVHTNLRIVPVAINRAKGNRVTHVERSVKNG